MAHRRMPVPCVMKHFSAILFSRMSKATQKLQRLPHSASWTSSTLFSDTLVMICVSEFAQGVHLLPSSTTTATGQDCMAPFVKAAQQL